MIGNLSEAGIAVDRVAVRTGVASGAALIMVDQQGGNILSVAPGANHFVSPEFVRSLEPAISGAAFVLLQNEIPRESVEAAIDLAHALGTPVMLNLAPAGPIDEARLGKLSYLVVNETEAESLCGFAVEGQTGVEAAADWILARGARTAIITLGAAGAYLAGQGFRELAPAFSVAAVDTTAAGDVYCGAIAAALVEGRAPARGGAFCVGRGLGALRHTARRAGVDPRRAPKSRHFWRRRSPPSGAATMTASAGSESTVDTTMMFAASPSSAPICCAMT